MENYGLQVTDESHWMILVVYYGTGLNAKNGHLATKDQRR